MKDIFLCAIIIHFIVGTASGQNAPSLPSLRFMGEYEIPYGLEVDSTIVGGLSGIDYDTRRDLFYAISDDRGTRGLVRFYTFKINITEKGINEVKFLNAIPLENSRSKLYQQNATTGAPDPEGIRLHGGMDQLFWVSEGERVVTSQKKLLADPFIYAAGLDGKFKTSIPIPPNLRIQPTEKGPRQNSALEGITFDRDFRRLYVALEEPLYEDGPRADTVENGAVTRLVKYDVATRKALSQFAYPLDKVAYPPSPRNKFRINGVSEILYFGGDHLITVERSFSTGRLPCTVKVFMTDLSGATDISEVPSVKGMRGIQPATKKLLLNLDDLGIYIDNVEGVTFGPKLPNGNQTLIFVTDNNFNWFEKTQLLLFEIVSSR